MTYSNSISLKQPKPLPETGFISLKDVLSHVPVSKSTWYAGLKTGEYPKQHRLSKRRVGWKVEDIRRCMAEFEKCS